MGIGCPLCTHRPQPSSWLCACLPLVNSFSIMYLIADINNDYCYTQSKPIDKLRIELINGEQCCIINGSAVSLRNEYNRRCIIEVSSGKNNS